ncbi:Transcriptional activator HAC1 [Spathaspora sp. JA1]|nr:Transcriptional activator HAC1 [Spathaspora sp. JA1]
MDASVTTSPTISHTASIAFSPASPNDSGAVMENNTSDSSSNTSLSGSYKTTLPPRKRAKTKEEKEQRRVERILRNRRAAHASREKKRKHVEYLEAYVVELEANLLKLEENFNCVSKLVNEEQLSSAGLQTLKDLSELKQKIHNNLSSSRKHSSSQNNHDDDLDDELDDEEPEVPVKKRKVKSEPVEEQAEQPSLAGMDFQEKQVKSIKQEPNDYLVPPPQEPCNYLSPISINSPINSPIDLTMRRSTLQQSESPLLTSSSSSIPTTPSSSMSSPSHTRSLTNIHDSYDVDGFIMTEEEQGNEEHIQVGLTNDENYGLDIEEFLSF